MKKRWLALMLTLAMTTLALGLLLGWPGTTVGAVSAPVDEAAAGASLALSVTDIDPATAPNDVDAQITIGGSGFSATLSGTTVLTAPEVFLGQTQLPGVVWVNTTTMSATVPWGLPPQVYMLTVVNPDGISATLPSAFTVTEGLGEFVTGGPYGGTCIQLALNPDDPATVYAAMFGAGLFISQDGAGHWEPIHDHDWPIRLDFDAQDADTLYLGADSNDLYRSRDNGMTWERISEDFYTENGCFTTYPVAHPAETGEVYFGMGSCGGMYLEPGEGGVYFSTDFGDTWTARNDGLGDLDVQSLAVHPNDPQTMLAGTFDGNIYYSQDGADSWTLSSNLTGTVVQLYFNPYETLQAWAIVRAEDYGAHLYRSTDLTGWTEIDVDGGPLGTFRAQMTFRPGSVWLASYDVYSSPDGGTTWAALDGPHRTSQSIAIAPGAPDVIYVGTDFGVEKSTDGGHSWQEVYQGLAALVPDALAVSVHDPDTVYVKTHQGIYASHNGGNDWRYLDYGVGGGPGGNILTLDPHV
ncbi:MAG: IPT/TIG domain-containing protein, partial [Anaerolineae bacterium]